MRLNQNSLLNMFHTFIEYIENHRSIVENLPLFMENFDTLKSLVEQIELNGERKQLNLKGVTVNKNQLKDGLIVTITDYANKLSAYAKFTNDVILTEKVQLGKWKISHTSEMNVLNYGKIVHEIAQPLLTELAPYGITAAGQTALMSALTEFKEQMGKPGANRSEGKVLTQQRNNLFKAADKAMKNMDAAVEIIKLSNPDFYNGYKSARRVISRGSTSLSVTGIVLDALTGAPLSGVKIVFTLENGMNKAATSSSAKFEIVKKTADKGGFKIKNMPDGTYKVTFKKVGYADKEMYLNIVSGELSKLVVGLDKL